MRILVVDFEFPEPDRSSGGHRLYHIIELLREAGHELAFISIDYWQVWKRQDEKYPEALNTLGVKTYRDGSSLSEKGGQFIQDFNPDVAILSKHYMANSLIPYLRVTNPRCRLILDTVDVHFVREQRQGTPGWEQTRVNELYACQASDRVWAITESDKESIVSEHPQPLDVHVVPNIHNFNGPGLPFAHRKGIVFVGNYVHEPNKDALRFMSSKIVPELLRLGCSEGFRAVGPYAELVEPLNGVTMTGWVEDLDDLLCRAKVAVAPLRYGAGMKGKIGSYMCNGLPVVTTAIGAEGMGLRHEHDALIVDDPKQFAGAVMRLYDDEQLWKKLSLNALEKVEQWGSGAVKSQIEDAVTFM